MITRLPIPLACLTLSHVINDRNAVEGYLSEDSSASQCMPLILRDLFFANPKNTDWNIPVNTSIPDATTTLKYLTVLWSENDLYKQIVDASSLGALYLIPYLFPQTFVNDLEVRNYNGGFHPINSIIMERWKYQLLKSTLTTALFQAAANGYIDVVRLLYSLGADISIRKVNGAYESAATLAATCGHIDTVLYLLSRSVSTPSDIVSAVTEAIYANNFPLFKAIYDQKRDSIPDTLRYLIQGSDNRTIADEWIKQINV